VRLKFVNPTADWKLVYSIWFYAAAIVFGKATPAAPGDAMRNSVAKHQASIAVQKESVRKQAATAAVWLTPFAPPATLAEAACDPLPDSVVSPLIAAASTSQQLEPRLLRAVIEQESGFRPCATSSKGASGLMQLMPETVDQLGVHDPFDPRESIEGGAKFLKQLLDRYQGDVPLALGAYNAGPATVDQAGGIPDIPETRDYVDAILQKAGIKRTVPPNSPKPKPTGN
jgi:soluble lytic murein transglycosylase-like protein